MHKNIYFFSVTIFGALAEFVFFTSIDHFIAHQKVELARFIIYLVEGFAIAFVVDFYQKKNSRRHIDLRLQMLQAEEANKVKSLFLANMSHEIRTPLTGLLGFTDLLLAEPSLPEEERQQYIKIIRRTGQNLADIINDILDLSKVEAGHVQIEKIDFNLRDMLSEVHSLMDLTAQEKNLAFFIEVHPEVPQFIRADATRLRQIIMNIIGNAIKFTSSGYVRGQCRVVDERIVFQVQDSGIGIQSEQKHKLFQNFSQMENSISRQFAGTGLGLSLSRQLAQIMGGNLELVESIFGKGSIFQLTLPFEGAKNIPERGVPRSIYNSTSDFSNLAERSVLVVDDCADNQYLLSQFLKKQGCRISIASNGEEALKLVEQSAFDLILMDMQMPVMDGYTTAENLRTRYSSCPIIALTANVMKEDRDRCLKSGCNAYVSKPIKSQELLSTMHMMLLSKSS